MNDSRVRRPLDPRLRGAILALAAVVLIGVPLALWGLSARLSALRDQRAVGPSWSFPSRVFSDAVTLTPGRILPDAYLIAELEARGYRAGSDLAPGAYARRPGRFEITLRGFRDEPDPAGSGGPERVVVWLDSARVTRVERLGGVAGASRPDTAGPPRLEPMLVSMLFGPDRIWRTRVSLDRIPVPVRDAIITSEDRRFYGHSGFDPRSTLRALLANARSGDVHQGGSTITQQLARGLFLGRSRTLLRKMTEIPLAMGIEILLSKDQVLEMYLNSVYWGQARGYGVGGIAEAARWYFDAPVESLDVVQGATLAAIIPSPNDLDPWTHGDRVRAHRDKILAEMAATHRLDPAAAESLARRPLGLAQGPGPTERFPSYSGYINAMLDRWLHRRAATQYGLAIYTTMDIAWQQAAEAGLAAGLAALDGGGRGPHLEGAFVALDPATAAIRAIVGGRDPNSGDFNRAWQARRQTGSAIKPIVYACAFASGGYTPASTVPDTALVFGRGRQEWRARNFDGSSHPEVTLAGALERSLNQATTQLVDRIGAHQVARLGEQFGLGHMDAVPSIGLGSNETTLLALTNAFAVFQAAGMRHVPSPLRAVVEYGGHVLLEPPGTGEQVLAEGIASLMTGLLQNVVRYGVSYPLRATYGFDRPVAGKTGTTDDYKDAWFVGFTPDVVAGVWVGYDRPRSIGRQAAHTALPIWARIVGRMVAGFPPTPFKSDRDLEWQDVEPWSGMIADSTCASEHMPFLPGTAPYMRCADDSLFWAPPENLDSLYARDSLWRSEPDTLPGLQVDSLPPDTAEARPR